MPDQTDPRRQFLKAMAGLATVTAGTALAQERSGAARSETIAPRPVATAKDRPRIRFGVVGVNHGHVYGQVGAVVRGGGELVSFYAKEPELAQEFAKRHPNVRQARSESEVLEDSSLQLVVSASIPDERAPLGVRVMQHGKDFLVDKPGATTLEQLAEVRRVQAETKRIFSILYSERLENQATVRAGELVKAGAIGRVLQTIGLGPHRMNAPQRPAWFFDRQRFGGILCDIALAPGRPVPLLHRLHARRCRIRPSGQSRPQPVPVVRGLRRRLAQRQRRHRLHSRRLVHSRWPRYVG